MQAEAFAVIAARAVVVPEGITNIPDGAITGPNLMVIYGYGQYSAAWNYANRNGLEYIRLDEAESTGI